MDPSNVSTTAIPVASPVTEREFAARPNPIYRAMLFFFPGVLILFGLFAGITYLAQSPTFDFKPGLNPEFAVMIVSGLFATHLMLRGLFHVGTSKRVVLSERGLQAEHPLWKRFIPWDQIHTIDRDKLQIPLSGKSIQVLKILNAKGRERAVITDNIEGFDELAEAVIVRSSALAGAATFDPQASDERRVTKDARTIRKTAWLFVAFTLAFVGAFGFGLYEEIHARRLTSEGVKVEAKVTRSWMNQATPNIEYLFKDAEGNTHSRETMMHRGAEFKKAEADRTILIEYLADAPEWNRPVRGEDRWTTLGGPMLLLTGFGILMFGSLAVVSLLGYDLDIEDAGITLMRHGRVVKVLNPKRGSRHGA